LRAQRAFTLIEISIVLVIIGLIIGGVLTGRDLIRIAEMRAQISQIEKLDTAINAFRGKYNCLPGDCVNATQFGLGTAGGVGQNGDGNGRIYTQPWVTGNLSSSTAANEWLNMWYHLSQSGLTESGYKGLAPSVNFLPDYTGYLPKMKMGNGGFVMAWTTEEANLHYFTPDDDVAIGNSYYFGKFEPWPNLATQSHSNIAKTVDVLTLFSLDQKIDDGLPLSGRMRVGGEYSGPMIQSGVYPNYACYSGTTNQYDITIVSCPFAIKASW
jgi:prepilin-type N-terminal cleavage/methylation domain-containing protein